MALAIPGINPQAAQIVGIVLVVTGVLMAFWGHGIWNMVMSMIGSLLGAAVGYIFGAALGGSIAGLVLAIVGAIIGSILFSKLVKVALAFLVGLLAGALVYTALGGTANFSAGIVELPLIAALLVLVVVFGVAFYFIDDLIGIITAAIGGLLLGGGLYILGQTVAISAAAGIGAFVIGAILQTRAINRKHRAKVAAHQAAAMPAAYPPAYPPPPPP